MQNLSCLEIEGRLFIPCCCPARPPAGQARHPVRPEIQNKLTIWIQSRGIIINKDISKPEKMFDTHHHGCNITWCVLYRSDRITTFTFTNMRKRTFSLTHLFFDKFKLATQLQKKNENDIKKKNQKKNQTTKKIKDFLSDTNPTKNRVLRKG